MALLPLLARDSTIQLAATGFRAIAFSRYPERTRWIESELARSHTPCLVVRSISQVVEILIGETDSPRPSMLIIDLDRLTAGELFHLHRVRELGWGGTLIALGKVPASLRASLGIQRVVPPPYVEDALAEEVTQHTHAAAASTMPLPLMLY